MSKIQSLNYRSAPKSSTCEDGKLETLPEIESRYYLSSPERKITDQGPEKTGENIESWPRRPLTCRQLETKYLRHNPSLSSHRQIQCEQSWLHETVLVPIKLADLPIYVSELIYRLSDIYGQLQIQFMRQALCAGRSQTSLQLYLVSIRRFTSHDVRQCCVLFAGRY